MSARVLPKQVAMRERLVFVRLRVKPALNPDEKHRRGLQKYRVLRTAAFSSTEEIARDDNTHVMLSPSSTCDRGSAAARDTTEGWALRAPTIQLVKGLSTPPPGLFVWTLISFCG